VSWFDGENCQRRRTATPCADRQRVIPVDIGWCVLRLLGFPAWFDLPADIGPRTASKLVGNSLSIPVVMHLLQLLTGKDCDVAVQA